VEGKAESKMIFLQERYWGLPILSRNPHPNCCRASKSKSSFGPPCIAHLIIQNFSTNFLNLSNYPLSSSDELRHLLSELLFFLFQVNVWLWIPFCAQRIHSVLIKRMLVAFCSCHISAIDYNVVTCAETSLKIGIACW